MKIRLKGCKRCGGDMVPEGSDRFGPSMICLQCGAEVMLAKRSSKPQPLADLASLLDELERPPAVVVRKGNRRVLVPAYP